jgi:hypothetical protein
MDMYVLPMTSSITLLNFVLIARASFLEIILLLPYTPEQERVILLHGF